MVGLFLPIRAASPPKAEDANWVLPTRAAIKRFDDGKYQSVRSARFWGEIKVQGQRGPRAVAWNLGAIVTRPTVGIAITTPGKTGTSWVRLGSEMPDGSTFVAANRDTVWYEKDGCRRARKLYQKPTAESDACIGAPAGPADAPSSGKAAPIPPAASGNAAPAPPAAAPAARDPH
ncbi:MAG TPA: hypothetical protein VN205_10090 [Thermomonas sp.]|nr:hypothetical protein [Thermomonas sp.]